MTTPHKIRTDTINELWALELAVRKAVEADANELIGRKDLEARAQHCLDVLTDTEVSAAQRLEFAVHLAAAAIRLGHDQAVTIALDHVSDDTSLPLHDAVIDLINTLRRSL